MVDNLTDCNANFITVTVKIGLNPTIRTRWHWYKAIVAIGSDPFSKSQILKTILVKKYVHYGFGTRQISLYYPENLKIFNTVMHGHRLFQL